LREPIVELRSQVQSLSLNSQRPVILPDSTSDDGPIKRKMIQQFKIQFNLFKLQNEQNISGIQIVIQEIREDIDEIPIYPKLVVEKVIPGLKETKLEKSN
jgi:hypothetical protein